MRSSASWCRSSAGAKIQARRPLANACCIALVLIIGSQTILAVALPDALEQQQQRQQQQLAQAGSYLESAQSAPLPSSSPASPSSSGSSSGSSNLVDSMINLSGNQPSGYLNSKRARKMSAFMPMRGRKDGRDSQPQQQFNAGAWPGEQYLPIRESDDSDTTILRLAMAAAAANQAFGATPRSFVDQMVARRAQQQQQQQQRQLQPQPQPAGEVVAFDSAGTNSLLLDPASTVMQAKLRRAFHPMRGKKFDSSFFSGAPAATELFSSPGDQLDEFEM